MIREANSKIEEEYEQYKDRAEKEQMRYELQIRENEDKITEIEVENIAIQELKKVI